MLLIDSAEVKKQSYVRKYYRNNINASKEERRGKALMALVIDLAPPALSHQIL